MRPDKMSILAWMLIEAVILAENQEGIYSEYFAFCWAGSHKIRTPWCGPWFDEFWLI